MSPAAMDQIGGSALQQTNHGTLLGLALGVAVGSLLVIILLMVTRRGHLRRMKELTEATLARRVAERTRELVYANERLAQEIEGLRNTESRLRCAQVTLEETTQRYARLSQIDPLTNLANRRKFDEFLEREWRRGARNHAELSLLVVDVDYFKLFNDTYGHGTGDDCLRAIAEMLAAAARRPGDLAARLGGEEFAVLLCDTGLEGAMTVARQIQTAIARLAIEHETTRVIGSECVTVSIGIASCWPESGAESNQLVYRADEALYAAKQDGRNCIRRYDVSPMAAASESTLRAAPASLRVHESLGRRSRP